MKRYRIVPVMPPVAQEDPKGEWVKFVDLDSEEAEVEAAMQDALGPAVQKALKRFNNALYVGRLEQSHAELLEALKEAKEFIENQQLPDAEWERILNLAVAAIAKAEIQVPA